MVDFAVRSEALELMDGDVPASELRETFDELAFVNRGLGGHATTLSALEALLPRRRERLSVLDVGCGGGDTAERIAEWAQARGVRADVHGIDLLEAAVSRAGERRRPRLSFSRRDLFDLPAAETYDVVHAALMLHHCPPRQAARALAAMYARCRLGVVINDLHRHPLAYYSIAALTAACSRNRLIRHDAPLSVLRAFSRRELETLCLQAGLPPPEIRWRWAFRWAMIVRR